MATVRGGDRTVLMVVDVQVAVVRAAWDVQRVVANVARVVERGRAAGVPVVWVQHSDDDLPMGSEGWRWAPELVPAAGEALIHKHFNSAFEETELEDVLARLGATRIVLAGAATNWCIRATAYGALDRGYDLTLVSDAHTTEDMAAKHMTVTAASLVTDLNIAMAYVSYPGRRNSVATAEAVQL